MVVVVVIYSGLGPYWKRRKPSVFTARQGNTLDAGSTYPNGRCDQAHRQLYIYVATPPQT